MGTLVDTKRPRTWTQGIYSPILKIQIESDVSYKIKLLMPKDTGKRRERPEEDLVLLEKIKGANPAAGFQFLEYLVLQRRSTVSHLLL